MIIFLCLWYTTASHSGVNK